MVSENTSVIDAANGLLLSGLRACEAYTLLYIGRGRNIFLPPLLGVYPSAGGERGAGQHGERG